MKQYLANRHQQLDLFREMAAGQSRKQILLIEAESGFGKTELLKQFPVVCPDHVCCVPIDLKAAKEEGVSYLLSRVRRRVGACHFPTLDRVILQFLKGTSFEGQDIYMVGEKQQFQVILTGDPDSRRFRLARLREAFCQDLRDLDQQVVMILDTFNEASPELETWIIGFLAEVSETPNLRVVLAGQRVPQPTIEWSDCCELTRLEPIDQEEDWYGYATAVRLPLEREAIKAVVRLMKGNPQMIRNALQDLAKEWQR